MSKSEAILTQVKEGYNRISEHFSATRSRPGQDFKLFSDYIKEGGKVLDLACGNGRLYAYLKSQNVDVDYYGLDNSSNLINITKEHFPEAIDRFVVGEMFSLPYQNDFFDTVICSASFHHLPTKELRLKTLSEIKRVLKPGGYLLMTNWSLWQLPFIQYFFNQFSEKISLKDFFIPWKSPQGEILTQRYYHAFTKKELAKLIDQSGLKLRQNYLRPDEMKKNSRRGIKIMTIAQK